ncbi:MAG: hypothetical protein RBS68_06790 [Anaerolineales bacterium]|jgi:uncharacterized protein YpmS|nr:hypothetical protein [Anaerolineales bacterium]
MAKKTLLAMFILILSSLACNLAIGGPEYPDSQIPISTEAVGSAQEQLKQAIDTAKATGVLAFSINESQVTSLVAQKISADPNSFITEPQVYLRDNEVQIFGKATQGYFTANVRIALSAGIDANGQPELILKSVDFGPLPAPEGLNNTISAAVNEAFTGAVGPAATGFRLESITIADGLMTFTGRIK